MGRPRKDRIGQHAGEFASELRRLLSADLTQAVEEVLSRHERELATLRRSLAALERRVENLAERQRNTRGKVGRWVPGGPGRPPKDAAARIAAFHQRQKAMSSRSSGGGAVPKATAQRTSKASAAVAATPGRAGAEGKRAKAPAPKPRRRTP